MIDLKHIDCMEYMKTLPDKAFELAIVDPPYGIGADKAQNNGGERWGYKKYKDTDWDSDIPSKSYFVELFRVSTNQIIWGGNYMTEHLFPTGGWIIWDKCQREFSLADGEMAWTSFLNSMRFVQISRGFALADANKSGGRVHPTQKPVKLYKWILNKYAKEGDKILDTHLGSGSIAIACHDLGFDLVGCEIDEDYYKAAVKRFEDHKKQLTLF